MLDYNMSPVMTTFDCTIRQLSIYPVNTLFVQNSGHDYMHWLYIVITLSFNTHRPAGGDVFITLSATVSKPSELLT